ncbi:MAG: hypothetical protein C0412_19930, partial [Flavobacterium sp.]|nr:hypothetical protein [Flavobacterium sp.]
NFEISAGKYVRDNFSNNSIIIQNATFINMLNSEFFSILYLQDNLRKMGRTSPQQESNLKNANLLVTNSKLTACSYPEYNFEIIPIGVDDILFAPKDKKQMRALHDIPSGKVGIFVGDFSEVKGWEKVKKIVEKRTDIFWILVSKDNKTCEFKNSKTYNRIDQNLLSELLNCADFFILGSPVETQCLAAIEAALCGLPVIMRNTGIFADFSDEDKRNTGYFGEDFEGGLDFILNNNFTPRQIMYKNDLTIAGMVNKWKKLIAKAKLFGNLQLNEENKKKPFFTVIVPTYNQESYLPQALDSLINQTFKNWEAIIVNDGSKDNTKHVMEGYAAKDKRFKCFNKENGGVASALNVGIEHASGEWICWLSSDDWFEEIKLQAHFEAIKENPEIKFFRSHWTIFFDEKNRRIETGLWLPEPPVQFQVLHFFRANYVHGNSFAAHKSVFENVGVFNESLRQGQDFDMWLRISAKYQTMFTNVRTCVTRIHEGQTTNSFVEGGLLDSYRALIDFINNNTFDKLFPFYDLYKPENLANVISEVINISNDTTTYLQRYGFKSVLIDKMLDWILNNLKGKNLDKAIVLINTQLAEIKKNAIAYEYQSVVKDILKARKFKFHKHGFGKELIALIRFNVNIGNQKVARDFENYLLKVRNSPELKELKKYVTVFANIVPEHYSKIKTESIRYWDVESDFYNLDKVTQKLSITCENCKDDFPILINYTYSNDPYSEKVICPKCKAGYLFTDENFDKEFIRFNHLRVKNEVSLKRKKPKVAFFLRDSQTVGGGGKIISNYMQWLSELGCDIDLYSFNTKPDNINSEFSFYQIGREGRISFKDADLYIIASIFDVPRVLNEVPRDKVILLCQGYEGYHYGSEYSLVLEDKYIHTQMHRIPKHVIVVSEHLNDHFKNKINVIPQIIPNGIDLNTFIFQNEKVQKDPSILFIGNIGHNLKGFEFLSKTIMAIQNSIE